MRTLFAFVGALASALVLAAGCAGDHDERRITVAAASSLQPLLEEVVPRFAEDTGIAIGVSYGASGTIANQIEHGAPIDVVVAASLEHVDRLSSGGFLRVDSIKPWANGVVTLVKPKGDNRAWLLVEGERIAIANPETAPYGAAAKALLENSGLWEQLEDRIVYADNVMQALQFARSGNVDFAFVPASLVPLGSGDIDHLGGFYGGDLRQTVAVVASTDHLEDAEAFANHLAGDEVAALLSGFGYGPPTDSTWTGRFQQDGGRDALRLLDD